MLECVLDNGGSFHFILIIQFTAFLTVFHDMKQTYMKRSIMKEAKRIKYESRARVTRFIRNYLILILVCCAFIFGAVSLYQDLKSLIDETTPQPLTRLDLRKTIVHLDLKGAPPDMRYLREVLEHLEDLGVNGILLEYDDMFQYKQDIKNLSSPYHYHNKELMMLLNRATTLNIEIIPLIQTFGHMEHALKLEEFQHLRENPLYADSICPSKNGSLDLLRKMIGQVMLVHKQLTPMATIHIGGGEVQHLNTCPDCTTRRLPDSTLYIEHIKTVAKMIKILAPDVTIMVWDDMFRRANITDDFQKQLTQLGKKYQIQPVVWDYTVDLSDLSQEHMKLYQRSFKKMWLASAYKGADGEDAVKPDLKRRLLNNLNCLKFAVEHQEEYSFSGLILTGRSRYSHLQPLCELLPMSYGSLVTTIILINELKRPHRKDEKTTMYTLKDWKLAAARYFDSPFASIKMCKTDSSVYFRPECKIMSRDITLLYENMMACVDALRQLENSFDTHNIGARVKFDYLKRDTFSKYLFSTRNFTQNVAFRNNMLKKSMRTYYSENVYRELILYKFITVVEKESNAVEIINQYIETRFGSKRQSPDGNYISWPRGRNFTVINI